ncbi:serine/threonine-protein kinase [uncultured Roseobacter sp.]|uniref:serine/threonine-protein kinase n=1 Tax=uncultured Roseobacter sp. TaxID=114847 RepID=UPI0026100458|nr:serine/threonine-protein kinase [uncultured Roseobacter sp.]
MNTQNADLPEEVYSEALPPGSRLLSGQYEIIRYLSSGGFGITYLARDSLNRTVVIKECFPEAFCARVNKTVRARTRNYTDDFKSIVRLFIREAHALSRLDHSSVVGVHQVFEDNETAYMALDLVDGKDLLEIIETEGPASSPADVHEMTLALLDAIGHVHAQDLLHRDISPDNILVDAKGRPVLIDFGAAREEASRKSRVMSQVLVVKDGYSPQEFYVAGSQQTPSSDLYALAATLSHLISGKAPPNSQARLAALASSQPDLYEPLAGRFPGYDDTFLRAIDKAMNIVPADRVQTAEEWALMIDHTRRAEMARAQALSDETIDETVMNLVRTVNEGLQDSAPDTATDQADEAEVAKPVVVRRREVVSEDIGPGGTEPRVREPAAMPVPAETPVRETPYARIVAAAQRMRAEQAAAAAEPKPPITLPRINRRRLATVPVVFCSFFLYTHVALKFEPVQTAAQAPIRMLEQGIADWNQPDSSSVRVHRGGLGG